MVNVFLDTNIFISGKYNLKSSYFSLLNNLIKKGDVRLLCSEIVIGEVIQHMESDITNAVQKYNKAQKEYYESYAHYDTFNYLKKNVEKEIFMVKEKINAFFTQENSLLLSLEKVNLSSIMSLYFKKKPPFETKKPYEFKDAFNIGLISSFIKEKKEVVYFITADEGMHKAVKGNSLIRVYQSLEKFYNDDDIKELYNNSNVDLLKEYITKNDLKEEFSNVLQNSEVIRTGFEDYEVLSFDIKDVLLVLQFGETKGDTIFSEIEVNIEYLVSLSCFDEERSIYDPEDKEYIYKATKNIYERHKKCILVKLEFLFNYGGRFELQTEITSIKELDIIELDDESFLEEAIDITEYVKNLEMYDEYSDYMDGFSDIGDYICCNCGKTVPYTDGQLAESKGRSVLCDACLTNYNPDDEF